MKYFVCDNETNGLPNTNRYFSSISIAYFILDHDMKLIEWKYHLLNRKDIPSNGWDSGAMQVHGISRHKSIKEGEKPKYILPKIRDKILSCDVFCAHNVSFDLAVINKTFDFFDIDNINIDTICTMKMAKKRWPNESKSLKNTWSRMYPDENFNTRFNHHNALDDTAAVVDIMRYFKHHNEL